ncbi:adenylate/guanylate cyclase domain-containing protein [Sneathiella limimaris]|uniref:adenylate/guanylate cyclase domain-containing protein n=1 Tax=Sneathiella limimaris TaxID=1964213 RepID=UPI00146F340F|nr:adenylate/guanylate cyclase domain-containing protein [Sneathiella limimaris]
MQFDQIIDWMMFEGRLEKDVLKFIDQFCHKLNENHIPVTRLRIGFKTIHPLLDIWAYIWSKEEGKTIEWGGQHGIRESASYYGSPAEWVHKHQKPFRRRLDQLDPEKDHNVLFELAGESLIDYLMLPMKFTDSSIPVITFVTDDKEGFSEEAVIFLEKLSYYIAPIIEIHAIRKIAVTLLDTYLGHRSGQRIMEGQIQRGDGEKIEAAIWFCDLRNFTALSSNLEENEMLQLLNTYFQILGDSISEQKGEILKFIGDAVLAVFPTTKRRSRETVCKAAYKAAQSALRKMEELQIEDPENHEALKFGIGLHFGEAKYGNIGSTNRLDFTIIGNAVNLASRIEALTKTEEQNLLYSEVFANSLDIPSEKLGMYELKGIKKPQAVYHPL